MDNCAFTKKELKELKKYFKKKLTKKEMERIGKILFEGEETKGLRIRVKRLNKEKGEITWT